jgi:hypothetical protein
VKTHNTAQVKQKSRQPQHTYKISSILSDYIFERVDEALFDKKWVRNFPLRLIKIGGGKRTTALCGCRKSVRNINFCFLRFSPWNTSQRSFPLPRFLWWSGLWMRLSARWATSIGLSDIAQGINHWRMRTQSICSQCNIDTCSHIVNFGPILELVAIGTWAGVRGWRMRTVTPHESNSLDYVDHVFKRP